MATETRTSVRYFIDYQDNRDFPENRDNLPLEFLLIREMVPERKRKDGTWVRSSSGSPVSKVLAEISREQLAEIIASGAEKLATIGNYAVKQD